MTNDDIDIEKRRLKVNKTRARRFADETLTKTEAYTKVTKTDKERVVMLSPLAIEMIEQMQIKTRAYCKNNKNNFLYPSFSNGNERSNATMEVGFKHLCDINSKFWCWNATHDPQAHSSTSGGSPWVVGATTIGGYGSYNSSIYDYGTAYCLAGWTLPWSTSSRNNVKYHVSAKEGHIVITMNGVTVVDIYDSTYTQGTYGFWGNNCEQVASMYLNNFGVSYTQTVIKKFGDVLSESTWRDYTHHIVVNVSDAVDASLADQDSINKTKADNITFIEWGSNTNKSSAETFISNIGGKGMFTYNSNYRQAVEDTANYIVNLLNK